MPLFLNIEDVEAADLSSLNANAADRIRAKGHEVMGQDQGPVSLL